MGNGLCCDGQALGAERVTIVYRRTIEEAPADIAEIEYVQSLGISIITKFTRKKFSEDDGKVAGLIAAGTDDFSESS